MAETSLLWDGTTPGDAKALAGNDVDDLFALVKGEGVISGYLNGLAVTGTSSPVAVNTGGAWIRGKPYWNSASVNVTVATPVSATRIDRIVLRADWTAKTIRIARVAGAEGGAAPALTQSDGVTWEISLATVSITTGGVITVASERSWSDRALAKAMQVIYADSVNAAKNAVVDGITLANWFLCDGSTFNGRVSPNMADRIPIGVGTLAAAQGTTAGASTKDVTHTHAVGTLANAAEATHTHAVGSIAAAAHSTHTHGVSITSGVPAGLDRSTTGTDFYAAAENHTHAVSGNTASGGPTTHSMSGTSAAGASHNHAISGASASGASATQDVLNPVIGVRWFMCSPPLT